MGADQPTTISKTPTEDLKLDATHLVGALAGLLGLTGYVYVLGGLALYIELYRTGVPAAEAIDEFASRRYLLVGLPIVGVFVVGVLVVLVIVLAVNLIRRHVPKWREPTGNDLASRRTSWFAKLRANFVASPEQQWPKRPVLFLLAIGAVLMVLCLLVAAFAWPAITLRQASVTTQNGECITGAYISMDSNGVNLADGRAHQLRTVPTAEVVAVVIGQKLPLIDQSISVTRAPCA